MASLPNTNFRMWDFNLAENFNQAAIAKLLISVFPINGTRFFFGNMYAILDKLRDDGVKLQFHRAYNGLIGLTGYTINEGSEEALIYHGEYWGFRFDYYSDFDPTSFAPVVPITAADLSEGLAAPNQYLAQGLTPASSSDPGPSSSSF